MSEAMTHNDHPFSLEVHADLASVGVAEWNQLNCASYPFLRYEFLRALETHQAVGERFGWLPRHITARDPSGKLLGAVPLYLKFNSYGEFVFDWSWADAYQRAGLSYYPKLVSASPYTPATGPKLLQAADAPAELEDVLIQATLKLAQDSGVSSLHWLFPTAEQKQKLVRHGLMARSDCQFHWENHNYGSFDDFLATFSSAKRKKIKRERRRVQEAGIRFRRLQGNQVTEEEWDLFHRLYESTFHKRGGIPTLSAGFFKQLSVDMPRGVLLVLAYHQDRPVAAAFDLVGADTLYGRHWGCDTDFHSLHFETCYYQGLDYCIEQGLARFEPGAQGEHKISRGFLPTTTHSAHWIADPQFRQAISRFLQLESEGMQDYEQELNRRSPYKKASEGG